jgi:hypothetical protein
VRAAAQYDLARQPAEDARHVSAPASKQPLRDLALGEPLLGTLLADLRELLGYGARARAGGGTGGSALGAAGADGATAVSRERLCARLRALCATTNVGFFQWCSYGRIPRGRLPSLPECGHPL